MEIEYKVIDIYNSNIVSKLVVMKSNYYYMYLQQATDITWQSQILM